MVQPAPFPRFGAASAQRHRHAEAVEAPRVGPPAPHCGEQCREWAATPVESAGTAREEGSFPLQPDQPVRWVSAAVISVATAVLSWAGINGFEMTTLSDPLR
jgi:hypothetical protein